MKIEEDTIGVIAVIGVVALEFILVLCGVI